MCTGQLGTEPGAQPWPAGIMLSFRKLVSLRSTQAKGLSLDHNAVSSETGIRTQFHHTLKSVLFSPLLDEKVRDTLDILGR